MFMTIYGRAFSVLMKKPLKLWGLSLLAVVLTGLGSALCGVAIPGLGIAVALLLATSMTMVYLRGYRGEEVDTTQLFACFKDWQTIKRVVLGMGWMVLWIFLWSLIPIVGPIFAMIRTYQYRLTPYILVTEPEVSITDAIKVSTERTKGYKLQMFLADIVYGLIFGLVCMALGLLALIPYLGLLFGFALFILYIVFAALCPLFQGLVQAAFYEEIKGVHVCTNCGAKMEPNAKFCASCGKAVE